MNRKLSLTKLRDNLVLGAFFLLIFLPVRIIFFEYVSEAWIGSVGLLSVIIFSIYYLSRKNKLGYIGRLVNAKLDKIKTSRLTKFVLAQNIFFLFVFTIILIGISTGNDSAYTPQFEDELKSQNITNLDQAMEQSTTFDQSIEFQIYAFIALIILPFIDFSMFSALLYTIDELSANWLSHFMIIGFIELIEVFVIIFYFRYYK